MSHLLPSHRPRPRLLALLTLLALAAALFGASLASADGARAAGTKSKSLSPSLLFVQSASAGKVFRNDRGKLVLGLRASRWTQTFTDRPTREAKVEPTASFLGNWGRRGFRADPPNAALSIDEAGGRLFTLELSSPRVRHGLLLYGIRPIGDSAKRHRVPLGGFGTASLFIDNAEQQWCLGEVGAEDAEMLPCGVTSTKDQMIVILELPPFTGNFQVTLNSSHAAFSPTQYSSGVIGIAYDSPFQVSISGCGCADETFYFPVMIQGGGGAFTLNTSIPLKVSPDNYSYSSIGPETPVTYTLE